MIAFGYHQSNSNHTLFLKKQQGKITILFVYVNDMVGLHEVILKKGMLYKITCSKNWNEKPRSFEIFS